jgi:hypothetical protein
VEGRVVQARDGTAIRTSGIVWKGEAVGVTAHDLVRPPVDDEERSAVDEAEDVLRQIVAKGPVLVAEARKQHRAAGVADRTADRARARLGVRAKPDGFGDAWRWHPPVSSPVPPVPNPGETDETGKAGETGGPDPHANSQSRQGSQSRQPANVLGGGGESGETAPGDGGTVADALEVFKGARIVEREPGCDDDDPTPARWWDR